MAARPIASATLSFGLVSIPVKLYPTGEPAATIRFHLLHRKCGSRLKQQYCCPECNGVVARDEMVKGYEFAKGRYVTFTPEELKALEPQGAEAMEIAEFVPADKVPPIFLDRSYYLGPDKGGERAYHLLARALEKSGRCALGRWASRGKQYLVLVRPYQGALLVQQLRYADEVRPLSEIPLGSADIKDAELRLALQIVEQATSEGFRPEAYEDEVRKRIEQAIERKVEGEEITAEPVAAPRAQVIDLMEALKASLAKAERKPARRAAIAAAEKAKPAGKRKRSS